MGPESAAALLIGAILGDSDAESMSWSRAIGHLSQRAEALSSTTEGAVRLNVVFHVDGKLVPNEFEGVRTGRFNRATSTLVVQVAVPRVFSGDRTEHLLGLLGDAVATAETYVVARRLGDGLPQLSGVVDALRRSRQPSGRRGARPVDASEARMTP